LFVLAGFFALITAQCDLQGNTYIDSDGNTLTFGNAVGSWVPGLVAIGDTVNFVTWTQQTDIRW